MLNGRDHWNSLWAPPVTSELEPRWNLHWFCGSFIRLIPEGLGKVSARTYGERKGFGARGAALAGRCWDADIVKMKDKKHQRAEREEESAALASTDLLLEWTILKTWLKHTHIISYRLKQLHRLRFSAAPRYSLKSRRGATSQPITGDGAALSIPDRSAFSKRTGGVARIDPAPLGQHERCTAVKLLPLSIITSQQHRGSSYWRSVIQISSQAAGCLFALSSM